MELTMTNNFGFRELSNDELFMIDGGRSWFAGLMLALAGGICAVAGLATLQPDVAAIGIFSVFTGISMMQN